MLFDLLTKGDVQYAITSFLLSVPMIILVLSVHEYAHGMVAKKLGDPTAENMGRLTLNPLKHIDPIGFVMFLLIGIGYAKPVPINSRYFKKPRRDSALVGAAGPLSNLALALLFAILRKLCILLLSFLPISTPLWVLTATFYLDFILHLGILYNLTFMVFNLLPVPPLDGSRILYAFLPSKALLWVQQHEQYFFWGVLGLFFISTFFDINIISYVATPIKNLICLLFSIPSEPLLNLF